MENYNDTENKKKREKGCNKMIHKTTPLKIKAIKEWYAKA